MSGYRDDLRAAHERIALLQREADDTRKLAKEESAAASARIEQLERQVAMLERDDVARALRERLEEVEQRAARLESEHKAELDAATMKILALEEAAYERTKDYDRAFARIGQLERELATAIQNEPALEAATMKILALEEAAQHGSDSNDEEVRAELDAAKVELGEVRTKLIDISRELDEKVDTLSQRDEEIEQLRRRIGLQSKALGESRDRAPALRYTSSRRGERSSVAPAAGNTAIQAIQQTDDDLARLSPAGKWEVAYRVPKAVRLRRRHRIAIVGMLVIVVGFVLALQAAPIAASTTLLVGAFTLAFSMLTGTTIHQGKVESLQKLDSGRYLVARINGRDVLLPAQAQRAIALGKRAVVERGNLGEGTLVVLTAVEDE